MENVIDTFGFDKNNYSLEVIGNGLINSTWKLNSDNKEFILQKINSNVFKIPSDISENITNLGQYLSKHNPDYLFISTLRTKDGKDFYKDLNDDFYRLMPFVKNSYTITTVENTLQATEAAKQFGRFSSLLSNFKTSDLLITLPNFHNLSLRFEQFEKAFQQAEKSRLDLAKEYIQQAFDNSYIVDQYRKIISDGLIPQRVIHHDTKISNVLFDNNDKGICVIDLDTVMPGYFISDLGDMMRTYLSPANEEEKDYSKIDVRVDFFEAIVKGYSSEMASVLTAAEKDLFIYSGKFMIYMQAIRFLADYLNNDIYYGSSYPGQNLIRAGNQFVLLQKYSAQEDTFNKLMGTIFHSSPETLN